MRVDEFELKPVLLAFLFGAPGGIRTHYPRLRKPILYPNELRAHVGMHVNWLVSLKVYHEHLNINMLVAGVEYIIHIKNIRQTSAK